MRRTIDGLVHRRGINSVSSALRDILEFNGFKFSEEVVFGIDCGLGFMYGRIKGTLPPVLIGGRMNEGVASACQILGIKLEQKSADSPEAAWQEAKRLIDAHVPVMLKADPHYLGYLHEEVHYGRHTVVLSGYDDEKGEAYVYDAKFEEAQAVPLEGLAKARSSTHKPFPPNNCWYVLSFPKELTKLEGAIKMAILENVEAFLDPTVKNVALKGVNYFAEQIVKWPEMLSPSDLEMALRLAYSFIDGTEGGEGLLRGLHSRFLRESGRLLGEDYLEGAADLMGRSSQTWSQIAKLLLEASGADVGEIARNLPLAREKILQCYDLEGKAFDMLSSLSRSWMEQFG
jgi:hypothetical protein